MKLYILADRLKRSVEEVLKAAKKLELDIKSSEQKLTHDQVIELTKYFTEKRRFLFFILLWNYLLGFLTAFIALFKRRGYLYGLISGLTIFTIFAIVRKTYVRLFFEERNRKKWQKIKKIVIFFKLQKCKYLKNETLKQKNSI